MYFKTFLSLVIAIVGFVQLVCAQGPPATPATSTPAPLGFISVPLSVDGKQFTLRFAPEQTTASDMATKFCTEQGPALGVTEATLAGCQEQVKGRIQGFVDRWVVDHTLQVPVVVDGTRFDVSFLPERDDISTLATRLCSTEQLKLSAENVPTCVQGVVQYLRESGMNWAEEKTLSTTMTIDTMPFDISFMPERQSPAEIANKLCVDYAGQLGLTTETLQTCVEPVQTFLTTRVNDWIRSKTLTTSVNINGQDYTVNFLPERESVQTLAKRVCLEKAEELQLTNENFATTCFNPLVEYFNKQVTAWVENKRVSVKMSIGEEEVNAIIVPERESTKQVASRICVQRASKLGLTNENIMKECVEPVNKLLTDGVTNWMNMRQKA